MPKCKYSEINPLNDTYTCTKPEAKYGTCACHDPLLCPAAEFEEDIPESDNVNHPNHYCQGGIECIKAIEASMSTDGFKYTIDFLNRARELYLSTKDKKYW